MYQTAFCSLKESEVSLSSIPHCPWTGYNVFLCICRIECLLAFGRRASMPASERNALVYSQASKLSRCLYSVVLSPHFLSISYWWWTNKTSLETFDDIGGNQLSSRMVCLVCWPDLQLHAWQTFVKKLQLMNVCLECLFQGSLLLSPTEDLQYLRKTECTAWGSFKNEIVV